MSRIADLDLRDPEVAHEVDNYGVYWDWPHFPVDTLNFINTGIRPSASVRVHVTFSARVSDSLRDVAAVLALLDIQRAMEVRPRW